MISCGNSPPTTRTRTRRKTVRLRGGQNFIPKVETMQKPLNSFKMIITNHLESHKHHKRRRRRRHGQCGEAILFLFSTAIIISCAAIGETGAELALGLEPQPLIYLHDAGSGDGYPRPVKFPVGGSSSYSSSSSMPPSLIAAKCWNNYENDNDCKQINVITGPSGSSQSPPESAEADDDSLITPVVIFESSSSYEQPPPPPDNSLSAGAGADLPSTSYNQDPGGEQHSNLAGKDRNYANVVLTRHRTPPASREEIFVTPPTTAAAPTPAIVTMSSGYLTTGDYGDPYLQRGPATQPTTSVYVATPQPGGGPKKAHKTTTEGRKCRDENDDDCDEPAAENSKDDEDDENDDDDDDNNDNGKSDGAKAAQEANTIQESGSGEAPGGDDDNESTEDDDSYGEENFESSGNSEPAAPTTPRLIELVSSSTSMSSSATEATSSEPQPPPTTTQQGAQIEVVVHSTLPPSFPSTTTTTTAAATASINPESSSDDPDLTSTPSTIMPDDTYKSKPVYPSSTEPTNDIDSPSAGAGQNRDISNNINDSNEPQTADDLATFKPIPMMPQVEQQSSRLDNFRNMSDPEGQSSSSSPFASSSADGAGAGGSKLPDRYKFEPGATTSAPAFKFDNAWRAKPVSAPNFQSNTGQADSSSSWQSQQLQRQRARFGETQSSPSSSSSSVAAAAAAVASQMAPGSQNINKSRIESAEMLHTLLLYASICILVVLALIFLIMAAAIWRQKKARQRALLHKSQLLGAAGQMVPSMSHASQLMGGNHNHSHNMQQPGLLTTYGPSKGLQLQNKITTSLIRGSADNSGSAADLGSIINGKPLDQSGSVDSNGNVVMQQQADNHRAGPTTNGVANGYQATNSSWSTEDQTTTSSSTGSQERADSRQTVQQQQPQKFQQATSPSRHVSQFNNNNNNNNSNSLSDGRQNSSSISDSQESQDGTVVGVANQHQQQSGPYLANVGPADRSPGPMYPQPHGADPMQAYPVPAQQMLYNQADQPMLPPQQNRDYQGSGPGFIQPDQMTTPVRCAPPPPNNGGTNNGYPAGQPNGFNQPSKFSNGTPTAFHPQQQQQQPGRASVDYLFLDGPPVNQARVAMNPLATMSRRPANYQHGHPGLNRNIYSEDSSSLMTASPSLARTSSSSSFAFANNHYQPPLDRGIEAKPMIDPTTGRLFNDYSQNNTNANNNKLPPIVGRKNPGEAWYV